MLVKRSTGQVRIGSATAPAYPLDVTGDVNSSTAFKVGGADIITTHAALKTGVHGLASSYRIRPQTVTTLTTGAYTLTIARLLTGLITGAPSAARAYTLDTGANCDAGMTIATDEAFDWVLINLATNAAYIITVTSPDASHTIVGNPLVASQSTTTGGLWGTASAMFRTRKTAANTFVTYRIA